MSNIKGLTAKREAFSVAFVATGDASEAYRQSHNAANMSPGVINNKASLLLKRDDIRVRIEELRAPVREKAQLTLESHLARLDELSRKAESEGQFGPAITAETNRGKASGLYVEKVDHTSSDGSMTPRSAIDLTDEQLAAIAAGVQKSKP